MVSEVDRLSKVRSLQESKRLDLLGDVLKPGSTASGRCSARRSQEQNGRAVWVEGDLPRLSR